MNVRIERGVILFYSHRWGVKRYRTALQAAVFRLVSRLSGPHGGAQESQNQEK